MGDERLGCSCLRSSSLGFGDVGASTLAIMTHFPAQEGPVSRERVYDLNPRGMSTARTTSNERYRRNLCNNGDTKEVDEADVLVPNNLDLIDQIEPAEIVPQLFFGRVLIQPVEIHIPAGVAPLDR